MGGRAGKLIVILYICYGFLFALCGKFTSSHWCRNWKIFSMIIKLGYEVEAKEAIKQPMC